MSEADTEYYSYGDIRVAPVGVVAPAYAGGEKCTEMGYVERIRAMDVVSDADWDADHPAGTSLADLIELTAVQKNLPGGTLVTPLSEVVFGDDFHENMNTDPNSHYGPTSIRIKLSLPPPPAAGRHVFTLKVSKDLRDFEVQSRPIVWE